MSRQAKFLLAVSCLFVSACAQTVSDHSDEFQFQTYLYLDTHPGFSPLVPLAGLTEYQLSWYRSWQPLVQIRIQIHDFWMLDEPSANVSFAVSEGTLSRLTTIGASVEDVERIGKLLSDIEFWDAELPCFERSFEERSEYIHGDDGCVSVTTLDGAFLTIAASEQTRVKAIRISCLELMTCDPFDELISAFLSIAGIARADIERVYD